jgi:hypothetical protein
MLGIPRFYGIKKTLARRFEVEDLASLTFSRRWPAMLMIERLEHKVVEKWERSQQRGQGRHTTPRDDAE